MEKFGNISSTRTFGELFSIVWSLVLQLLQARPMAMGLWVSQVYPEENGQLCGDNREVIKLWEKVDQLGQLNAMLTQVKA